MLLVVDRVITTRAEGGGSPPVRDFYALIPYAEIAESAENAEKASTRPCSFLRVLCALCALCVAAFQCRSRFRAMNCFSSSIVMQLITFPFVAQARRATPMPSSIWSYSSTLCASVLIESIAPARIA